MISREAHLRKDAIETPAFVIDDVVVKNTLSFFENLKTKSNFNLLYSLKSLGIPMLLESLSKVVDGFSVSSYYEAKLAKSKIKSGGTIHFTSPGLRMEEVEDIATLCDFISFNSVSQLERFKEIIGDGSVSYGIRVNPQMSTVSDERYDPCRRHSKLGVPLDQLLTILNSKTKATEGIEGIHIHANSESVSADPLLSIVSHLESVASDFLESLDWINLGGGYYYQQMSSLEPFHLCIDLLKNKYGLQVYIEPGDTIVKEAGSIYSTVIDMFNNEGKDILVLDTSVNHMPEVFEYQYPPDVQGSIEPGEYNYLIVGSTCLAGDLFGEYSFNDPLVIGSKVVFQNVGAYSLVKANMFNGINLPNIYYIKDDGQVVLTKKYNYSDFISRWETPKIESE